MPAGVVGEHSLKIAHCLFFCGLRIAEQIFFHTADGRLSSIPLTFTDLVEVDPFVAVSAGRAWLGIKDQLRLAELSGGAEARDAGKCVKTIAPDR